MVAAAAVAAAATELARLLAPGAERPIELGGATALFEAIAGGEITAEVTVTAGRPLGDEERELLRPGRRDSAAERRGPLRAGSGLPVAYVTAVFLPLRIPPRARLSLGLTRTGALAPGAAGGVPLGRALRGCSVTRRQLGAVLCPGADAPDGRRAAVRSAALLLCAGRPLALVTEHVYEGFLLAFPPPWQRACGLLALEPAGDRR